MKTLYDYSRKIVLVIALFAMSSLGTFAQHDQEQVLPEVTVSCTIHSGSFCLGEFFTLCFNFKYSICTNPESNEFWWV